MQEPSNIGNQKTCHTAAFTLVELLVVIGIIALLISILLPSLNKARKQAYAVQCESNMRQLGIGFISYADSNHGYIPYTGYKDGNQMPSPVGPADDGWFWANAVPPLVGSKSYYQLQLDAQNGIKPLAKAGDNNLFVCPMAGPAQSLAISATNDTLGPDGTFMEYENPAGSPPQYVPGTVAVTPVPMPTFWCYVMNSKIDNTISHPKISVLTPSTEVPLLVEKMTQPGEIVPAYNGSLARGKTTYTRFTGRHNKGGFLLFCDGHVGFFTNAELQPAGGVAPATNPAFNIAGKVTWDPFQTPRYGT